ncbi:MAG TPA: protein kinase [Gemmatimonadaceae bacterium]|nr:protein kinase [Gemmatimonadaceae bacterium]
MTDPIGPIRQAVAGRYAIEREIGQGAFATVYLARDLRHDRYVAFKILNADPSSETGELRFLREIRMLASLQHPNILPLIDSGHAEAMLYYVMPYVTGESLRGRIGRERQLAFDAAVAIAREASDALECAHQKGIIHRDIKPENILLSAGHPVIADFGIARAIDLAGVRQLTRTGIGSPGTPAYMSPEQLMGDKEVDRRTDIYSLGAVLFEMLTGKPPFGGKDGLVKRFTEPPPLPSAFRSHVPPALDTIVTKALARDPRDRYSTAADLAAALEGGSLAPSADLTPATDGVRANSLSSSENGRSGTPPTGALASDNREHSSGAERAPLSDPIRVVGPSQGTTPSEFSAHQLPFPVETPTPRRLRTGTRVAAVLASVAAIVAVVLAWSLGHRSGGFAPAPARRWDLVLPDSAPLSFVGSASLGIGRPSLALAPDGSRLVYVGQAGRTTMLYYHDLDKPGFTRLDGTDGAYYPFFSPNGNWVAFYADGFLKKISVPEGQLITLARVKDPMGGDWAADGRILVADDQGTQPAWVSDAGGVLQPIQLVEKLARQWRYPRLLPGGAWALHTDWDGSLTISSVKSGRAFGVTSEGVTRRDSTDVSKLVFGTNPVYVPSGHIVYLSGAGGVLMALPFDAERLQVLGPAAPVLQGVRQEAEGGGGQFAIAHDGTLIYAPGADAGVSQLVWLEPPSKQDTLPFPKAKYGSFDLSPDGKQILVRVQSASGRGELWLFDIDRGSQTRINTKGTPLYTPRWWPDGKHILFAEFTPAGGLSAPVVRQTAESFSRRDTLVTAAIEVVPSPHGKSLAVTGWRNQPGMWVIPTEGNAGRPVQLVPGPIFFMSFSPDGRWIVYGVPDPPGVYVSSTETPDERHPISANGGEEPRWSPRGDQIIYRNREQWFAVDVTTRTGFHASRPRLLFNGPYLNVPGWSHDISPDGRRQLLLLGPREETSNRLVAVTDWLSEVRRLAPAGN